MEFVATRLGVLEGLELYIMEKLFEQWLGVAGL